MRLILATVGLLALTACVSPPALPGAPSGMLTNQPIPTAGQGINAYRRAAGVPPVFRSAPLDAAARLHARDMARRSFFSHNGSDGSTHTKRIRRQGCSGGAENIADGPYSATTVMAAWMGSPGHRANIIRRINTHYGLANVGNKWVMLLSNGCP